VATPGRVCVLAYSRGSLDGSNTSPAMRTGTCSVPVFTVAVSPTCRPLWVRNAAFTSTWPGASYQCPAMMPYPTQDESPPNAQALTVPDRPGTVTWLP
jgi:hypothetical protein